MMPAGEHCRASDSCEAAAIGWYLASNSVGRAGAVRAKEFIRESQATARCASIAGVLVI